MSSIQVDIYEHKRVRIKLVGKRCKVKKFSYLTQLFDTIEARDLLSRANIQADLFHHLFE